MTVPVGDEPVLQISRVSKSFGGAPVLREVSFELQPGEVLALAGENGAGKSTLLSIITGLHQPDSGEIRYRGQDLPHRWNPSTARAVGISTVHQELSLNPHQNIAENILMGAWPTQRGLVGRRGLRRAVAPLLQRVGLDLDPETRVSKLSLGQQQLVELAKSLNLSPRVLILDEVTSALDGDQVAAVYRVVDDLRREGASVIVVSHRLTELLDLADQFTVLKDGAVTANRSRADVDSDTLVQLMLGRELTDLFPEKAPTDGVAGPPLIHVEDLSTSTCEGLGFDLPRGQIIGLGGMQGQGQREVLRALFGLERHSGRVQIEGRNVDLRSPREAISRSVVYVPEDRKVEGVHIKQTVAANLSLPNLGTLGRPARLGTVNRSAERALVHQLVEQMQVKISSTGQQVARLSGGNQQKVAIAKWLHQDPRVFLLAEPTRGIDVGTKREIYHLLRSFAETGKSVLITSGETMELVGLCDEVIVMFEGRSIQTLRGDDLNEENLVRVAVTGKPLIDSSTVQQGREGQS